MKKTNLFLLLLLITLLGAGTASFAACTATSPSSVPGGVWGIEVYGQATTLGVGDPYWDNILLQLTFAADGSVSGTEWQSVEYSGVPGGIAVTGSWLMGSPAKDCQGTFSITGTGLVPATQNFTFAINNGGKGGTVSELDEIFTLSGFMVEQGTVTCSNTTFKNKKLSLYSYGDIYGLYLVTGSGEVEFSSTGTSFSPVPSVQLNLGTSGNVTVPASITTGTASLGADCVGTGTLTVGPPISASFSVDSVVVDGGKELLWIESPEGTNVEGYFLE